MENHRTRLAHRRRTASVRLLVLNSRPCCGRTGFLLTPDEGHEYLRRRSRVSPTKVASISDVGRKYLRRRSEVTRQPVEAEPQRLPRTVIPPCLVPSVPHRSSSPLPKTYPRTHRFLADCIAEPILFVPLWKEYPKFTIH